MTVRDLLEKTFAATPDHLALIDRGRPVTYAEFATRTHRLAHGLLGLGLTRSDRVAVQMDNRREPFEIFAACAVAGLVYVPFDSRMAPADMRALLEHSGARVLVVDAAHGAALGDSLAAEFVLTVSTEEGGDASYEQLLTDRPEDAPEASVEADDLVCLLYTSGTTGAAKGVCTSQGHLVSYLHVPVLEYDLHPDSRYLVLYPHSSAAVTNSVVVPAWAVGATIVIEDVRDITAEDILATIERHRVTHLGAVPTMMARILDTLTSGARSYDLSSVTTVWYGSTPMAPAMASRLLAAMGPVFVHVYGMTEHTGTATTLGKAEHEAIAAGTSSVIASCGRPVEGVELEIVDDDGAAVPTGAVGEIRLRSAFVMSGYWRDPLRTAQALRDGWLYTGDLARRDADGYVYIVDRKKDLIVRRGEHIASKEIEDALHLHDAVIEAAAVGVQDPAAGEEIYAFVALASGRKATPDEIAAIAAPALGESRMPKTIVVLPTLPKNAVGKIQKAALREHARSTATGAE